MEQYLNYLNSILTYGELKEDRTGTGTISSFGHQIRFDLKAGFPLVTTKYVPARWVFEEFRWFANGMTNIKYLVDKGISIWDKDAYRWFKEKNPNSDLTFEGYIESIKTDEVFAGTYGDLGPIYGRNWRRWVNKDGKVIDQLAEQIQGIKDNPNGRRHVLNAWDVGEIENMALPPCHMGDQLYVSKEGLSCRFNMRSNDAFLGGPFNIASYAFKTHFIAKECGLEVNELIMDVGDAHIYLDHIEQVKLQLSREPLPLPTLEIINPREHIWEYEWEDIKIHNYQYHPAIKGEMST